MKLVVFFPKDSEALLLNEPGATFGGASVQMLAVVTEALSLAYEVVAVAPVPVTVNGVSVPTIQLPVAGAGWRKTVSVLYQVAKCRPNYILQHGLTFGSLVLAVFSLIIQSRFVFMVAHDREACYLKQTTGKKVFYAKWVFRMASMVVVQHDGQKDNLKQRGIRKTVVMTLPLAIPDGVTRSVVQDKIVWIARAEAWKRPQWFIDFAKKYPTYQCVMICPPTSQEYFEMIRKSTTGVENLCFLAGVPYMETWSILASARVLANSSESEGFPQTFVQAFALGIPVVTAGVDPNQSISGYGCGVVTGDEEEFALALIDVYENFDKYKEKVIQYYQEIHCGKTSLCHFLKSLS